MKAHTTAAQGRWSELVSLGMRKLLIGMITILYNA